MMDPNDRSLDLDMNIGNASVPGNHPPDTGLEQCLIACASCWASEVDLDNLLRYLLADGAG